MHYHALHVLFFFFLVPHVLYPWCIARTLSPSLSSFSFFLMATKNYVLSKNPIRRRGSSSSSSAPFPPDFIRFHDKKARDDFFENFFD